MNRILVKGRDSSKEVVLIKDNELMEYKIIKEKSVVSNIYAGRIVNIINNNFMFIDIGADKNAFLDLKDPKEKNLFQTNGEKKVLKYKMGQQIIIQVLRDGTGEKGPAVTSQINFSGEYLAIFKCLEKEMGISKNITSNAERERLKNIGQNVPDGYGVIFRTNSENVEEKVILAEFNFLKEKCDKLHVQGSYIKPPALILKGRHFYLDTLKEFYNEEIDEIILSSKEIHQECLEYFKDVDLKEKIKFLDSEVEIFALFELESQMEKLYHKKIWLKSGGFIYIEETEALVIIDVNSGKNIKTKNKDNLSFNTNLEAMKEIFKQIRLRNLSGIILVDFIDLKFDKNNHELLKRVIKESKKEQNIVVHGITKLGILEMTKKKDTESLLKTNMVPCSYCLGLGVVINKEVLADRIFRQIFTILSGKIINHIEIVSTKTNVDYIKNNELEQFEKLMKMFNASMEFKVVENNRDDFFAINKQKK